MNTETDLSFRGVPQSSEYAEYFTPYVAKVNGNDVVQELESQIEQLKSFAGSVSDQQADQLHPPSTWTIKQVIGHLIDSEKIFGYRLHRFGHGDLQDLPGFEQDDYIANMNYGEISLGQLVDELTLSRQANVLFLKRLPAPAWDHSGSASGNSISVRALAYVLAGHVNHHLEIIKRRLEA